MPEATPSTPVAEVPKSRKKLIIAITAGAIAFLLILSLVILLLLDRTPLDYNGPDVNVTVPAGSESPTPTESEEGNPEDSQAKFQQLLNSYQGQELIFVGINGYSENMRLAIFDPESQTVIIDSEVEASEHFFTDSFFYNSAVLVPDTGEIYFSTSKEVGGPLDPEFNICTNGMAGSGDDNCEHIIAKTDFFSDDPEIIRQALGNVNWRLAPDHESIILEKIDFDSNLMTLSKFDLGSKQESKIADFALSDDFMTNDSDLLVVSPDSTQILVGFYRKHADDTIKDNGVRKVTIADGSYADIIITNADSVALIPKKNYSNDGKYLSFVYKNNNNEDVVAILNVETGDLNEFAESDVRNVGLAWYKNIETMWGAEDGFIYGFGIDGNVRKLALAPGEGSKLTPLAISPSGKYMLYIEKMVELADIETMQKKDFSVSGDVESSSMSALQFFEVE